MGIQQPEVKKMRVAELRDAEYNPRAISDEALHGLRASMERFGLVQPVIWNKRTGNVVGGHQRLKVLRDEGVEHTSVVVVDLSDVDERAANISLNNPSITGEFTDGLDALLCELREDPTFDGFEDLHLDTLLADADVQPTPEQAKAREKREKPLDCIFTLSSPMVLSVAYLCGWRTGTMSERKWLKPDMLGMGRYLKIAFVDNEWHDYDYQLHLDVVSALRPKYCTVRDFVTRGQAAKYGVPYMSEEQIMTQAEELAQHAERVILIPKYDCLADLPLDDPRFMLGYSVESSYGGTPLPIEAFEGYDTHLLGGSWGKQLACLRSIGDSVVSLDNNCIYNKARFGVVDAAEQTGVEVVVPGFDIVGRHLYPTLTASMAVILNDIEEALGCATGQVVDLSHEISAARTAEGTDDE